MMWMDSSSQKNYFKQSPFDFNQYTSLKMSGEKML